jgi:hypothetical protein
MVRIESPSATVEWCCRFLLKALDLFWHEDCLKCGCCDCRLGEVGSTLYTKADLILCRRDYLRYSPNSTNGGAFNLHSGQ